MILITDFSWFKYFWIAFNPLSFMKYVVLYDLFIYVMVVKVK